MMAGSTSRRGQLEKRSAEVLCPADASVPGSFAFDEIVEKLSRVNRGGSISDLPADMSRIQIQDFGRFSKLIWGDDRSAPISCSSCGAVDFQASSHAILKSPSLAFLHSVWRTKTTLLDKKDSCFPRISKLFDTTSDYKHIRKMLGEDRACADSSSDHVAARVERREASYISGSQYFQVGKVNVQSWACVSFSCLSLKEIITVLSELRELMAPGMDISPEPTLFIHATTYSHHTDIKQGLLSAREFFRKQSNAEAKLLVILHDAEYSDGYLDELCKDIEVYQSCRCSPKPHKGDLKNVASEIMLKVLDFKARKSSVDGSSELEEFGKLFRGEDTDGSYNNKNDTGAEEISEDKPSEKQQLHVEKSSTKKQKHADCDELHGAELIRDEEPRDANKDSSRSLERIWNDFIFTPSIQCTCGFHFRAPLSSAFLLSVWRTEAETKLLDKNTVASL
ncbi:uncharacterized protein C2845_PM01G38180 [Panicum miliaceum]|uniref:Uncharacterized protein n=1 Tax=Panicum miliaceum TaxID=4540 RepID=A0A3L6TNI8_PANMI|nr:uncharacterized protein C2845_PM01G38180 [Panicum miliaceum]